MSERVSLVKRYGSGERMTDLAREYGISRKTGYKFVERYERWGEGGVVDYSQRPKRSPKRVSKTIESLVVAARKKHSSWGPKKLRLLLERQHAGVRLPSVSTIANLLRRHQLVKPQRRRRTVAPYTAPLAHAKAPNDVWCIDFKGQFLLGDGTLCYPLTVTDAFSRTVLLCEAFDGINSDEVRAALTELFLELGLPRAIRSDNGEPFVSPRALHGLSRFTAWLMRLGIVHERIQPGCPQQNGRHERMHRTLKAEATRPASRTLLAQQERFDEWRDCFNNERPHEALAGATPSSMYKPSSRPWSGKLEAAEYPLHDLARPVWKGGMLSILHTRHKFFLTESLVGEHVGIREVSDGCWLVSFSTRDLGHYNERNQRFTPLFDNPGTKVAKAKRTIKSRKKKCHLSP
jgi:transposase InsO family protein